MLVIVNSPSPALSCDVQAPGYNLAVGLYVGIGALSEAVETAVPFQSGAVLMEMLLPAQEKVMAVTKSAAGLR